MLSEVYKANAEVKKLYYSKKEEGKKTTLKDCYKEYAKSLNYTSWDDLLGELKSIDRNNNICPKCLNVSSFNHLVYCSKCKNRYDANGNII